MSQLFDRVMEQATTTGIGTFTLTGNPTGYRSFSVGGPSFSWQYVIAHETLNEWEVGAGTWTGPDQFARNTVYSNSLGTTAKIDFSGGNKLVWNDLSAQLINKLVQIANNKVLGRAGAGTGDPEQIEFTSYARAMADDTSFPLMFGTLTSGETFAPPLTGAVNNWAPPGLPDAVTLVGATNTVLARDVTGLTGGFPGRLLFFRVDISSPGPIRFRHENAGSSVNNRFALSGIDWTVNPGEWVLFRYDVTSSRWQAMKWNNGSQGGMTGVIGD